MLDPALMDLYSTRLKEWGATIRDDLPLSSPPGPGVMRGSARKRSPLCGSQITFTVDVDTATGTVTAIGHVVRACALTEAAAGIVVAAAPGCTLEELRAVRDAMRAMLKDGRDALPGGRWQDLEILKPAHMVPSRHGSALLPFETVIAAVEDALKTPDPTDKSSPM